jgi:hypothetical protein
MYYGYEMACITCDDRYDARYDSGAQHAIGHCMQSG